MMDYKQTNKGYNGTRRERDWLIRVNYLDTWIERVNDWLFWGKAG